MAHTRINRILLVVIGILLLLNLVSLWSVSSQSHAAGTTQYKVVPRLESGRAARDLQDILDEQGKWGTDCCAGVPGQLTLPLNTVLGVLWKLLAKVLVIVAKSPSATCSFTLDQLRAVLTDEYGADSCRKLISVSTRTWPRYSPSTICARKLGRVPKFDDLYWPSDDRYPGGEVTTTWALATVVQSRRSEPVKMELVMS